MLLTLRRPGGTDKFANCSACDVSRCPSPVSPSPFLNVSLHCPNRPGSAHESHTMSAFNEIPQTPQTPHKQHNAATPRRSVDDAVDASTPLRPASTNLDLLHVKPICGPPSSIVAHQSPCCICIQLHTGSARFDSREHDTVSTLSTHDLDESGPRLPMHPIYPMPSP